MANYTVKNIDEMEAVFGGAFKRARAELGVESFGMQVLDMPPNVGEQYPEHDHSDDGQEEVYVVLRGSAEIEIEGERHQVGPGTMVRVGPGVTRRLRTGSEGARVLALGGCAGKPYEAPDVTKLGAPDPLAQQSA
jgi:mannose-6-phosphate isomerase-like protein (cupin superfamily)